MNTTGFNLVERIGEEIDHKGLKRTDLYKIVPSGTLSSWKNKGQEPRAFTLLKVANFLGTSVDYLLSGVKLPGISEEETELIALFRKLDTRDQTDVLGIARMKFENAKKGDTISSSVNA